MAHGPVMEEAWEQYLQDREEKNQAARIIQKAVRNKTSNKKIGGKRKTKRNRTILPRLRKVSYKNKKHRYRLKDPFRKRKKAIHEGVKMEAEMKGRSIKKAAIAKKGRFNVLRIYRRNKKIKECNTITHDMRYMDKKYGLGKTKNICGQKGGNGEESDDDDYPVIAYPPRAPRNNEGTIEYRPLAQGEDPQSLTMRRRRVTDDRSPTGQRVSAAQVAAANERWAEVERRSYCPSSCVISGGKKKSRRKKKKSRKRRKKRKSRKKRR